MMRKLAIEVQQVKSSGGSGFEICALSTAECTRPRLAAADGGVGGPRTTLSDLHSSVGDPIPFRMIPRGTEPPPPASFN